MEAPVLVLQMTLDPKGAKLGKNKPGDNKDLVKTTGETNSPWLCGLCCAPSPALKAAAAFSWITIRVGSYGMCHKGGEEKGRIHGL